MSDYFDYDSDPSLDEEKFEPDLEALKSEPHATMESVGFTLKKGADPDQPDLVRLREYLHCFFEPKVRERGNGHLQPETPVGNLIVGGLKCRGCGRPLNGLLGTFTWGICHGEGFCSHCGLPARAYHVLKDDDGEEIMRFNMLLQYHAEGLDLSL